MGYVNNSKDPLDLTFAHMARNYTPVKYKLRKGDNFAFNRGNYKIRKINKGQVICVTVGSFLISFVIGIFVHNLKGEEIGISNLINASFELNFENTLLDNMSVNKVDEAIQVQELLEEKEDILEIRQEMIQKYCGIYGVDYDIVYRKIIELTDNFSNENFVYYLTIDGVKCKKNQPYAQNEEELFIYTIRAMAQTPNAFGFDDSIFVERTFESSSDYFSIIDHYARVFQINRNLLYSIIAEETGHFRSDQFLNRCNPAGLRLGDSFTTFGNHDEGIIELCTELLKYHFLLEANTIEEIGSIHAPLEDNNFHWIPNVTWLFNDASISSDLPFSNEEYVLWEHNGEEVYSVSVNGDMETLFGDRELFENQRDLH